MKNNYLDMNMKIETLSPDQSYSVWGLPGTLIWGFTIVVAFILTHSIVMGLYIGINYGNVASSEFESLMIELQDNGLVLSLNICKSIRMWTVNVRDYQVKEELESQTLPRIKSC